MKTVLATIYLCFIFSLSPSFSQQSTLNVNLLSAIRLDNNSMGYSINLEYSFALPNEQQFSIGIGQAYSEKKRPEVAPGFTTTIRDKNEFMPLGNNFFGWDESAFQGISFDPRESVYMNIDFFTLYNFRGKPGNKFKFSLGPIFSIRDHSQIDRYIYALKYDVGPFLQLENVAIPVYSYANYLDIGVLAEAKYTLKKVGRLDLDAISRFKYYPKNGTFMVELGANFGINFKEKKGRK